jgi:hypothetical protein
MAIITLNNNSLSSVTTLPNGISGQNYPAFEAYLSADTSISNNTLTVIPCNTEIYDTDSCYDTSTYTFTPNVAGKYYIYGGASMGSGGNVYQFSFFDIRLNGSLKKRSTFNPDDTSVNTATPTISGILDMNGTTDSVNLRVQFSSSISNTLNGGSTDRDTYFGAFRIGD